MWHRLRSEPDYADVAADLVACAAAFCCRDQRIVNLIRSVVSMLRAALDNLSAREQLKWELDWA